MIESNLNNGQEQGGQMAQPANPNIANVSEPVTAERAWKPFNDSMQQSTDRWMEIARNNAQQTPSAYMQLREVRDREDMDRLNNARRSRDLLEAAVANTEYGGQMTPRMVAWMNQQRGIVDDGKGVKNGQILNGGYNPETGGFGFTVANVDQNGNVTYAPHEMPRTDVYGFMANRSDLFRPEDVERAKNDILRDKRHPYTEADLEIMSSRYKDGKDRFEAEYADAQNRWYYRRGRGGSLFGGGQRSERIDIAKMRQDGFMRKYAADAWKEYAKLHPDKQGDPSAMADFMFDFENAYAARAGARPRSGSERKASTLDGKIAQALKRVDLSQKNGDERAMAQRRADTIKELEAAGIKRKDGESDSAYIMRGKNIGGKGDKPARSYDTQLSDDEEKHYQAWRAKLPKELQYEGDYDLRGFWKENGDKEFKSGDHMTDKFKKPNHKTFSVESKYAIGEDAKKAGHWEGDKFVPAGSNSSVDAEKEKEFTKWYAEKRKQHGMEDMPEGVARSQFDDEWTSRRRTEAIDAMTPEEEKAFGSGSDVERDRIVKKVLARLDNMKK